jgi:hypothetical protein
VPDQPIYALIVQPTIGQEVDDWHRATRGRPAPGLPEALCGYGWTVRDVVHSRDHASGQAPTEEEARAAAERSIAEPEPEPEDPDVELVRRRLLFDQELDE